MRSLAAVGDAVSGLASRSGGRSAGWSIPIVVDGRRSAIRGEIRRLPAPLLWPWLLLVGLGAASAVAVAWTRTTEDVRVAVVATGSLAGVAAMITITGSVLDRYASLGTWVAGVDEAVLFGACAAVAGFGPSRARVAGMMGIGVLALVVGLTVGDVFLHPIVLSVVPSAAARLAAALSIAAGLATAILGCAFYARSLSDGGASVGRLPHFDGTFPRL